MTVVLTNVLTNTKNVGSILYNCFVTHC